MRPSPTVTSLPWKLVTSAYGRSVIVLLGLLASTMGQAQMTPALKVPWLAMEDAQMRRLPVPVFNAEVAVYEAGMENPQRVVMVHGLGQDGARIWANSMAQLAKDYHVVAFDLPGFGASTKGNHAYSPEAFATVLGAVVEATERNEQAAQIALVGHSLGGAVSLYYASQHAASVRRLLLVDVAGILHRSVYTGFLSRLGIRILPDVFPHQEDYLSGLTQTALGRLDSGPEPALQVFNSPELRSKLLAGDPDRIAALGLVLQDYSDILPSVTAPTLLIWGQNDPIAPLRTGRMLASVLPFARLRIIPAAGHSPMLEAPKIFDQLLRRELDRSDEDFAAITVQQAYALPRYSQSTKHDIECDGSQQELVLEGDYRHVSVTGCDNVLIRNSHLASLHVHDARLRVDNSHILGLGLRCNDSRVEITGGSISGVHAIDCEDSELDLAGVYVQGQRTALKGDDTRVFLSVSRLHSEKGESAAHGVLQLDGKTEY